MKNPFNKSKKADNKPAIFSGIMFWKKDKVAEKQQTAEAFMGAIMKHLPALKEILRPGETERPYPTMRTMDGETTISTENGAAFGVVPPTATAERIGKLYDFFVNYWGAISRSDNFTINVEPAVVGGSTGMIVGGSDNVESAGAIIKTDPRIIATPKSVLEELEKYPAPDMLLNLDEKIATLNDKSLMTNQRYASDQLKALIKRLENRRKYHDHEQFYKSFPNTDDAKIDNLLKKYRLVIKTHDIFVPTFPKEAIDVMKEYTRVTKEVCGEEPVYYVIAEEEDFKKKFEKLDPILLVQSPFGFWWQVLGAWDKEMLLLCEL